MAFLERSEDVLGTIPVGVTVPNPAGDPFGVSADCLFRVRLVFLVKPDPGTFPFQSAVINGFVREFKSPIGEIEPFLEIPFQIAESLTSEQIEKLRFRLGSSARQIIGRLRNGPDALTVKKIVLECLMGNQWVVLEY